MADDKKVYVLLTRVDNSIVVIAYSSMEVAKESGDRITLQSDDGFLIAECFVQDEPTINPRLATLAENKSKIH